MLFPIISENKLFFYEVKCDGITSLHGIHEKLKRGPKDVCLMAIVYDVTTPTQQDENIQVMRP